MTKGEDAEPAVGADGFDIRALLGGLTSVYGEQEVVPLSAIIRIQQIAHIGRLRAETVAQRHGLTLSALYIMLMLQRSTARTPLRATELGKALALSRGAVSKILDQLQERSLIERSAGQDRRSFAVMLTPSGRCLADALRAGFASARPTAIFSALSAADWLCLDNLLAALQKEYGVRP